MCIMNCDNCNELLHDNDNNKNIINSKNFAVKMKDGRTVCNACAESIDLFEDISENKITEKKVVKINVRTKSKSIVKCIFCNEIYIDNKCIKCEAINPLLVRKNKKPKKKKKKKKKNICKKVEIDEK